MWLGLADAEEYEEYDPYEAASEPAAPPGAPRMVEPFEPATQPPSTPAVRTIPRNGQEPGATINLRPAPTTNLRSVPSQPPSQKVHVAAPAEFADAQEIADRFRNGQPVIVNLGNSYRELGHRMIDFCSGVAYALGGTMDKVADKV
ncbi:MAG TPA: cell division protein SepF, partial [Acidimicrobiales bacterium]|nr:cell division protein SepF [Acidimicrobiales bacterium]